MTGRDIRQAQQAEDLPGVSVAEDVSELDDLGAEEALAIVRDDRMPEAGADARDFRRGRPQDCRSRPQESTARQPQDRGPSAGNERKREPRNREGPGRREDSGPLEDCPDTGVTPAAGHHGTAGSQTGARGTHIRGTHPAESPSASTTDSGNAARDAPALIRSTPAQAAPVSGHRTAAVAASDAKVRHTATSWPEARVIAERAGRRIAPRAAVRTALGAALGHVTASVLTALTDLPAFDTSAMDGWAVSGPGPWSVCKEGILAGYTRREQLLGDGQAVRIATGARVPRDATAVIRSEHGRLDDRGRLYASRDVTHGQDIRPRGQECRSGDLLLSSGALITPAVLGLAAAAGYDELFTVPRPRAEVFVLGDELLAEGLSHDGLIRDALGPMLPPWLRALGAETTAVRALGDDAEALLKAITTSEADLLVTTGGTAAGPLDQVHPTLSRIDAELLVDGVKVRPGHPMLLARTKEDQYLVGLPGNPLAAVSGLMTLAEPLLRSFAGRGAPPSHPVVIRDAVAGHPYDTRLVPVLTEDGHGVPLRYNGPAMLRGIAVAEGLAVVPPGGAAAGQKLKVLDLPWTGAGNGECFT